MGGFGSPPWAGRKDQMEKSSNAWEGRSNSLPRGTLADLVACGQSGKKYGSCSGPVRGENIGCGRYHGDPEKGVPPCPFRSAWEANGRRFEPGPTFLGVEIIREEPGVGTNERQTILTCWDYMTTKPLPEDPYQIWTVLGGEGTPVKLRIGAKQPLDAGQTQAVYRDDYQDAEVPHFIRCTEAKNTTGRIATLRAERIAEQQVAKRDRLIGAPVAPAPLPDTGEVFTLGDAGGKP